MRVKYKGIVEERFEDAPFIGALLLSVDCHHNCPGCFNQYLKEQPSMEEEAEILIAKIKENPLHQGIVLGGLEWSEQPEDLYNIVQEALKQELQVMIYTHHNEIEFVGMFPWVLYSGIYVKYGEFQQGNVGYIESNTHVNLASSNQHIIHYPKRSA